MAAGYVSSYHSLQDTQQQDGVERRDERVSANRLHLGQWGVVLVIPRYFSSSEFCFYKLNIWMKQLFIYNVNIVAVKQCFTRQVMCICTINNEM